MTIECGGTTHPLRQIGHDGGVRLVVQPPWVVLLAVPLTACSADASHDTGLGGHTATPHMSSATVHAPAEVAAGVFAGQWSGHTRQLRITRQGQGMESIGDGCCDPIVDLTFRFTKVNGTRAKADATVVVASVKVHDPSVFTASQPAPRLGEIGDLHLVGGVITDSLTQATYCDAAAEAKGTCGA